MSATAANLVDYAMPKVPLRQWVLTVPFAWRSRLGFDGALLGAVVRKFADAVLAFYRRRLFERDGIKGQSGAVLVVQRTSSDLRLNPHVHAVFLDGVHHEGDGGEVKFHALPRLETEDVACVLEDAARRITRYLRSRRLFDDADETQTDALAAPEDDTARALAELAANAASGITPPAGPVWKRGALPALTHERDFDQHLTVGRGGFTLHAATRAGAMDDRGREALLKYVLRPPSPRSASPKAPRGSCASRSRSASPMARSRSTSIRSRSSLASVRPSRPHGFTPCGTQACSRRQASFAHGSSPSLPRSRPHTPRHRPPTMNSKNALGAVATARGQS